MPHRNFREKQLFRDKDEFPQGSLVLKFVLASHQCQEDEETFAKNHLFRPFMAFYIMVLDPEGSQKFLVF